MKVKKFRSEEFQAIFNSEKMKGLKRLEEEMKNAMDTK